MLSPDKARLSDDITLCCASCPLLRIIPGGRSLRGSNVKVSVVLVGSRLARGGKHGNGGTIASLVRGGRLGYRCRVVK